MWRFVSHDHNTSRRYQSIQYPPSLHLIIILHFVLWLMIFVCTWCSGWCIDYFFHFGMLIIFLAHVIYSGVLFLFTWWPTHPPCKGFTLTRIASHWNVGRWWVVLLGPVHAPSYAPSKPINHQLTPIHPYPPSHLSRFLRRRASLNNGSNLKNIAGTR